jgi:uncharacterized repeat protein (TIGR01451 family)
MPRRRLRLFMLVAMLMLAGLPALIPPPVAAAGTADLAVTMVGDAKRLKFGETITFTVTATNLGPDAATGVTLGVGVSDSLANVGSTCPDGMGSNICVLGTLASGESVTVLFQVMAVNACCPNRVGVAVASVSHDGAEPYPDPHTNVVQVETKLVGKFPS